MLGGVTETHLKLWELQKPIVKDLLESMYVDDLISGEVNVQQVVSLKEGAIEIFKDASFNLHKWHSNVPELETKQSTDGDLCYAKQQLETGSGGKTTLLGLSWDKIADTIGVNIPDEKAVPTKRGILAKIAKLYDPLGLASPTTLVGKLAYREACEAKLSWDQTLPDNMLSDWKNWEYSLPSLVSVPRCAVKQGFR